MSPESPMILPRPNLGPEPWPSPTIWPWVAGIVALGLIVLWVVIRRRRRPKPGTVAAPPAEVTTSPTASVELPDRVREALIRAFGTGWRARTTEEVAASAELRAKYGDEVAGRVIAYLGAVDRAKFSHDAAGPADDLAWWASRFAEEAETGDGGGGSVTEQVPMNEK